MGDWCTVNLRGTLAAEDVAAVREFIAVADDWSSFHCLSAVQGLCSLGMWAAEEIHANGNLAERNYGPDAVAETLREIVAVAPSLSMKVHCGGEHESVECIATVTAENGAVSIGDPEVEQVEKLAEDVFKARLFGALGGWS